MYCWYKEYEVQHFASEKGVFPWRRPFVRKRRFSLMKALIEKGVFPWWRPFVRKRHFSLTKALRQKKAFFADEGLNRKRRFSPMKAVRSKRYTLFSIPYHFIFWLNFTYLSCCFIQEQHAAFSSVFLALVCSFAVAVLHCSLIFVSRTTRKRSKSSTNF